MNSHDDFDALFQALTGYPPLSWHVRLYQHFLNGGLPSVIDIPTGLGKTMVMAVWLIAQIKGAEKIPTRLIYVVDRRTVVDQATDVAEELRMMLAPPHEKDGETIKQRKREHADTLSELRHALGGTGLAISTLRGQLADNREWSRDPSKPAIIIGTVDLIGSALLFSGYRSSYKRRPLEAGLLGQDSLLVLDEAHLSKPFAKLLVGEKREDGTCVNGIEQFQSGHGKPLRVIRMSATSESATNGGVFRLDTDPNSKTFDLWSKIENSQETNPIRQRYEARKTLIVRESTKLIESIAAEAGAIATQKPGSRIVIFVKSPKDVDAVKKALLKDKSRETTIAQLTGTMRGLERDQLVDLEMPIGENQHERRVMQRFLHPDNDPSQGECFLISTSAGEVGFDLNADHLVGDAAPLDSWIQRLGRVNRRGTGDATVIIIKEREPADKSEFDRACQAAMELFTDGMDVSPKALDAFKKSLTAEQLKAASTPKPTMVELTDILLDAWSMTSITTPMPGRPEVAPWLRGIADDLPQTTLAWRAELDLFKDDPDPRKAFKAIFAKHPLRPHECLTTNSYRVIEFFKEITKKNRRPELRDARVVIKFSRDLILTTIGNLVDNPGPLNADPTLILPATFGGLEKGMLSQEAIPPTVKPDAPAPHSLDRADIDGYESRENVATRWRTLLERTDGGWRPAPLPFGRQPEKTLPELLDLQEDSHSRTEITNSLRKLGLQTREVIKFDFDDEGDPRKLLLLLSGISQKAKRESQPLDGHIRDVVEEATRIAKDLHLKSGDHSREALLFAAKWHDDGKRSPVWQRFIGGPETDGEPRGKSDKYCDPKQLAGYRHEFGSLLRMLHPDPAENREKPEWPDESVRELALHLIAVHHGHGRPHFRTPIDRDFHTSSLIDGVHADCIRRFARLQHKYGHWHLAWLENLLRCADTIASAKVNDDENQDDEPEAGE